jgi:hypothetical protein
MQELDETTLVMANHKQKMKELDSIKQVHVYYTVTTKSVFLEPGVPTHAPEWMKGIKGVVWLPLHAQIVSLKEDVTRRQVTTYMEPSEHFKPLIVCSNQRSLQTRTRMDVVDLKMGKSIRTIDLYDIDIVTPNCSRILRVKNKIFVASGDSMKVYHMDKTRWKPLSPPPPGLSIERLFLLIDKHTILIMSEPIHEYDIANDCWKIMDKKFIDEDGDSLEIEYYEGKSLITFHDKTLYVSQGSSICEYCFRTYTKTSYSTIVDRKIASLCYHGTCLYVFCQENIYFTFDLRTSKWSDPKSYGTRELPMNAFSYGHYICLVTCKSVDLYNTALDSTCTLWETDGYITSASSS